MGVLLSIVLGIVFALIYGVFAIRKDIWFLIRQNSSFSWKVRFFQIFWYVVKPKYVNNLFLSGLAIGFVGWILGILKWDLIYTVVGGIGLSLLIWFVANIVVLAIPLVLAPFSYLDMKIRFSSLRFMLTKYDLMPWSFADFLDSMVNFLMLRKSGNNYFFTHSLLRDYYARDVQKGGANTEELTRFDLSLLKKQGRIYFGRREYGHSLFYFTRAVELKPKEAWNYHWRGRTYREMEEYDSALSDFNRTIELNPKEAWNYHERGRTYYKMEEYDSALPDFNRAIELNPKGANHYYWRGLTYHDMEEYDSALSDLNRAIELEPKEAWNYYQRGRTYYKMEEYDSALSGFNRAIELNPKDVRFYYWRGQTYKALKEPDPALSDFDYAIELEPQERWDYYWRGRTYFAMEEYDLALSDLNCIIELNSKEARIYYWRSRIYEAMEEYDLASSDIDRAIELDPKEKYLETNSF